MNKKLLLEFILEKENGSEEEREVTNNTYFSHIYLGGLLSWITHKFNKLLQFYYCYYLTNRLQEERGWKRGKGGDIGELHILLLSCELNDKDDFSFIKSAKCHCCP